MALWGFLGLWLGLCSLVAAYGIWHHRRQRRHEAAEVIAEAEDILRWEAEL